MKVKPEQLDRLASQLVEAYRKKELIVSKASDAELKTRVIETIKRNFAEEEAIEEEARKMLAGFAQVSKDMDPFKMFLLAKQKLAQARLQMERRRSGRKRHPHRSVTPQRNCPAIRRPTKKGWSATRKSRHTATNSKNCSMTKRSRHPRPENCSIV